MTQPKNNDKSTKGDARQRAKRATLPRWLKMTKSSLPDRGVISPASELAPPSVLPSVPVFPTTLPIAKSESNRFSRVPLSIPATGMMSAKLIL